jgi:hypothetical protein
MGALSAGIHVVRQEIILRKGGGGPREEIAPSELLRTLSESFDVAQDDRRGFVIDDYFPFMLRASKHSEPFFSNLLG